jgi:hypothetical protein
MKFIIPQNYNFKNKLFGVIDYSNLIFDAIWFGIVLSIVQILFESWNIKIFLLVSLTFPVLLISIIGFNGESFINVIIYLIKYIISPKLYLFKKF